MDLIFSDHGSIVLLAAHSPAGRAWIADHIPDDAQTWCGSIVVEPRYVDPIWHGAICDGLNVNLEG